MQKYMSSMKRMSAQSRSRTTRIVFIAVFVALIAVGAFIKVSIGIIPVSMQFCFCMLAGLLLGWKDGTISVLIYLALGLAGVPIFTMGGGIMYVLQPTFGYMIGFIFGTAVCGVIARGANNTAPKLWRSLLGAFVAMAIVYTVGVFYMYLMLNFYIGNTIAMSKAWLSGCALFLPTDSLWCVVGSLVAVKVVPIIFRTSLGRGKLSYKTYDVEYMRNPQLSDGEDCDSEICE